MEFRDKLSQLRREKGYSQEDLAQRIGISRQAVTKWEMGQGYPDVDNLIKISDIFSISIDRLVKTGGNDYFLSNLRNADVNEDTVIDFLIKAKKSTYSANGLRTASSRPESQDLHFSDGDYLYIDTYLGGEKFGGEEAVWCKGKPVWCMNYAGRLLEGEFSGDFLKESLRHVTKEAPYRGPGFYQNGDYSYHCICNGSFEWFQGYEEIYLKSEKVYDLFFHGGRIK